MAIAKKVTKENHLPSEGDGRFPVYSKQFNELVDFVNTIEDSLTDNDLEVNSLTSTTSVTSDSIVTNEIQVSTNVVKKTVEYTVNTIRIVGTNAGDIGHADGVPLVAAQAGVVYEFESAVLIYDFDTAAYTGGGNDLVIRIGSTAVSSPIAGADLLLDTEDDIAYVNALSAADIKLTANSTINLAGTAYTNPGTAAGVLRVILTYKEITTNL